MRRGLAVAALTAIGVAAAVAVGGAGASAAAEADTLKSLVETYEYPGRDQILADGGPKLVSGDGNITYVPCDTAGDLIKIESYDFDDFVCFQLRGEHGQLTLEIGRTTFIWSDNEPLEATVTYEGVAGEKTKDVKENTWVQVGEAENMPSATLLEIRA